MTAKEYLTNISRMDEEIKLLEDEILETQTRLTHITPILSDMPTAHGGADKMINGIIKMVDLKTKLNAAVDRYVDNKNDALDIIGRIENQTYRLILIGRYCKKKSFELISTEINYSYFRTCRMHGEALKEFSKLKDGK